MNWRLTLYLRAAALTPLRTKKKEFLEQIERIVPWNEWTAMIKPCYYKGERGNKPYDLELMLRLYLMVTSKNPQKYRPIEAFSIIGHILTCK